MGQAIGMQSIEKAILPIRGTRVIIDSDLAALYGVETRRLSEQVRRNRDRFPWDFAFQLSKAEKDQVVAERDHLAPLRFSAHLPLAFTVHGALMAASVLDSPQAAEMSVFIVRAFVRLRSIYATHLELTRRLDELDARASKHGEALRPLVEALRRLMLPRRSHDTERLLP